MSGLLVQRLAELNLIRDPASAGTKTLVISRHRKTNRRHQYIAAEDVVLHRRGTLQRRSSTDGTKTNLGNIDVVLHRTTPSSIRKSLVTNGFREVMQCDSTNRKTRVYTATLNTSNGLSIACFPTSPSAKENFDMDSSNYISYESKMSTPINGIVNTLHDMDDQQSKASTVHEYNTLHSTSKVCLDRRKLVSFNSMDDTDNGGISTEFTYEMQEDTAYDTNLPMTNLNEHCFVEPQYGVEANDMIVSREQSGDDVSMKTECDENSLNDPLILNNELESQTNSSDVILLSSRTDNFRSDCDSAEVITLCAENIISNNSESSFPSYSEIPNTNNINDQRTKRKNSNEILFDEMRLEKMKLGAAYKDQRLRDRSLSVVTPYTDDVSQPNEEENIQQPQHITEDGDTDQETDRLLGQQRADDPGYSAASDKVWRRSKSRTLIPRNNSLSSVLNTTCNSSNVSPSICTVKNNSPSSPSAISESCATSNSLVNQSSVVTPIKISNSLNNVNSCDSSSTSDIVTASNNHSINSSNCASKSPPAIGGGTNTTSSGGASTAPSTPIGQCGSRDENSSTPIGQVDSRDGPSPVPTPPEVSTTKTKSKKDKESNKKKGRSKEVLIEGVLFRARYLGSTQLVSEGQPTKTTRMMQAEEAVTRIKTLAPDGESQPNTEVDLFISTEKIMVLNTDLKEIMMDHALRTISYIADIGDLVVLMARRRMLPTDDPNSLQKTPKMICHVFESDEAQFIAQSIGQAFQVAYLEFLKANGIEDHSFVKEMDYQEVLNSQEIFGDELQMFAKKELQKEVVVPKMKSEILGVVVVESGWGSMVPTVVIANLSPYGAAAKCGQLNIGDQIIAINGVSLVGLPLSTCQNYIKNTKYNTAVKLTVVPCPPVVEVKIRRPDTKYQLGFSVQNGVICSLLRGGIAERGGVRVGHRIIDINSQSVVAVPHEKIVNLLATSVGEIRMKTMPTSIFRLLTGQETPQYI